MAIKHTREWLLEHYVCENQMTIDDYENYQSFTGVTSFDIPFSPEPMAEVKGNARRRPVATEQPINSI